MRTWHSAIVLLALSILLVVAPGCASQRSSPRGSASIEGIERPARSMDEEEGLSDKMGEVGVVLLVVGSAIAGILLPLLLL
jgi:hypothetical protein